LFGGGGWFPIITFLKGKVRERGKQKCNVILDGPSKKGGSCRRDKWGEEIKKEKKKRSKWGGDQGERSKNGGGETPQRKEPVIGCSTGGEKNNAGRKLRATGGQESPPSRGRENFPGRRAGEEKWVPRG